MHTTETIEQPLEAHLNRQLERSRDFFWNRLRWNLIASQIPSGQRQVVDVGAGPGFLGDYLKRHRPEIEYGYVEPIEGLERSLSERFGAGANRRERDFPDASHVTLLDVLEHQEDDREFLTELAGKMSPGAKLLLTVPAMPWLWSEWDALLGHYRRYTKPMLSEVVRSLPFELVEQSYIFPELIPAGMVRRLRMRAGSQTRIAADPAAAEFPDLSPRLDQALYRIGGASIRMRRLWPCGTSLFAVLSRSA